MLIFDDYIKAQINLDFLGFLLYDKSVNEGKRVIALFLIKRKVRTPSKGQWITSTRGNSRESATETILA